MMNETLMPDDILQDANMKSIILDSMRNALTVREREILEYRFGFSGRIGKKYTKYRPLFRREIAAHYNLSQERIRQIEWKAKRKIISYIVKNYFNRCAYWKGVYVIQRKYDNINELIF